MAERDEIRGAALEEVTEAAFNGVLKALERRQLSIDMFPGPIIVGIIAWPDLRNIPGQLKDVGQQTKGG